MKWTHWITVKEAAIVPKTRIGGNVFFALPGNETEPIGNRIIETPEDGDRFELRDPHSGFIAYVPPGSIDKGSLIVSSGAGKTIACRTCHGTELMGLGPVPGIAGRSPSYLMRQLWDFKKGTRHGEWSPLMQQVVKDLSQEDLLNVAAYLAAAGPK
jgi:cytochrome c553